MATPEQLAAARLLAEEVIRDCQGTDDEARIIGDAVVDYVLTCWNRLRLYTLIEHQAAWTQHVQRHAIRRYLEVLDAESISRWQSTKDPLDNIARSMIQVRADSADLSGPERELFDAIYVDGMTGSEAAIANDLSESDMRSRLRTIWEKVRRQFPELF